MSVEPGSWEMSKPTAADAFVGREHELERIGALLTEPVRLVTLVGSGGIGKTRLALAVARRIRKAKPQTPVYWVHLVRLPKGAPAAAVEGEVLRAVVDGDFSDRPVRAALADTLGRSDAAGRALPAVLVLDNCEHVLDGAGAVVADLLGSLPGLTVLATSRTALGWVDEHIVQIPPLSLRQALTLFRQRAELTGRPVSGEDEPTVAAICRRLHNYPLHIRLAAARLRYQPLPMILRDLEDAVADRRLRWAAGFRVGVDDRHRDLSTVIGWSYDLCGARERLLFERMSVFASGYDINPDDGTDDATVHIGADLEAIEAVCADPEPDGLTRPQILDVLEQLVDRSMVSIHVGTDTVCYSLLESFRVFARQRLRERDDSEWARLTALHRRYYRDRIVAIRARWVGPQEKDLLAWARVASDNLMWAVDGSLTDPAEAVIGLEIAAGFVALRIPFLQGSLREVRGALERSLAAVRSEVGRATELEVSARALLGWINICQGLPDDAERLLRECVADCFDATADTGWAAEPERDRGLPAAVEYLWGSVLLLIHGDPRALTVLARARVKFDAAGDPGGAAMSALFEALTAAFYETPEQSLAITRNHLDSVVLTGAQWVISWGRLARAIALSRHGDPDEAMTHCSEALAWQVPMADHWGGVWGMHIRGWILARMADDALREPHAVRGQIERRAVEIARLHGGAAARRAQLGLDLANLRPFATRTEEAAETARKILGPEAFDAQARLGATTPDVGRLAVGDPLPAESKNARSVDAAQWADLTSAEKEVAVLAAAGLTNAAIAARRGTSQRTVDAQITAILSKLMINSRREIRSRLPTPPADRVDQAVRPRPGGVR